MNSTRKEDNNEEERSTKGESPAYVVPARKVIIKSSKKRKWKTPSSPKPEHKKVAGSTLVGPTVPKHTATSTTDSKWNASLHDSLLPKLTIEPGFLNPRETFIRSCTTEKLKPLKLPKLEEYKARDEVLDPDMEHIWGSILREEL